MARPVPRARITKVVQLPRQRQDMSIQYNNKVTIDDRINDLKAKIATFQGKIQRLEECRDAYNNLPFKEGEAAFVGDLGNVLIRSIEFGPATSDFEDIVYVVVAVNGASHKVSYKKVIPISEATKALYGSNKEKEKL